MFVETELGGGEVVVMGEKAVLLRCGGGGVPLQGSCFGDVVGLQMCKHDIWVDDDVKSGH